ncbi:LysE family translocator [Algoriphagus namhaensis]
MGSALIEGAGIGLLLSAIIGPVFFSLVQGSLSHGFRYAAALAFGIFLSDTLYAVVTYFGVHYLSDVTFFEYALAYLGGAVLIGFGINSLVKKKVDRPNSGGFSFPRAKKRKAFLKGFGINGINPFVLLFWISIASLVQVKKDFDRTDVGMYYMGLLLTVFAIDLLKALVAKQLSAFMTDRFMWGLNKVVGVLIIGFGLRMIWWALMN